ncbi:MAG: ribbon-helix-helix domain-containing protein [Myxococcota bacterium]|nr:ribbon-helix-helix domain-containing protein [Myxococcota bacterium]
MLRIQLHLSSEQDRRLRQLAKERSTSRADLIRRGIELVLAEADAGDPLLSVIGTAPSGPATDLSEHHDRVLYGAQAMPLPEAADRELE